MSNYKIRGCFSVHVLLGLPYEAGTIILPGEGVVAPGADNISLDIYGKASHGAAAHLGKSTIPPAIALIQAINNMMLGEIPASNYHQLNWGVIQGGDAVNIVAEKT